MRGWLIVALLLLAIVAIAEWAPWQSRPAAEVDDGKAPAPGYWLRDATVDEFGSDGRPVRSVRAARLYEVAGGDSVLLEEVGVSHLDESGRRWQLSADRGRIDGGTTRLSVDGNVRLTGLGDATLTTTRLDIDTGRQVASTDATVYLVLGRQRLEARGFHVDMNTGRVRLESQVNGRYFSPGAGRPDAGQPGAGRTGAGLPATGPAVNDGRP